MAVTLLRGRHGDEYKKGGYPAEMRCLQNTSCPPRQHLDTVKP